MYRKPEKIEFFSSITVADCIFCNKVVDVAITIIVCDQNDQFDHDNHHQHEDIRGLLLAKY